MSAASTDYFTKVSQPGGATSLAAPGHTIAGTSISVDSTSLWPTDTGVIFAIDTVTISAGGAEVRDANSYTVWEGVVSSATTITSMVLRYGTDQNYPAGSTTRVYILPTASRENRMVDGLLIAHNEDGTLKNNAVTSAAQITDGIIGDAEMATAVKPVTLFNENTFDHVVSGCIWTADAAGSTRNASMSSGVVMLAGKRLTVAAVVARSCTASKDVYVDFSDNSDGTAIPVYFDNTTNAASPSFATTTGTMRNAIIVVGATNIATTASINQGQEDRILPIASSIAYSVTDSLGNLICPRDPNRRLLCYRQLLTNPTITTPTSATAVQGLTAIFIPPLGRKFEVSVDAGTGLGNSGANDSTFGVCLTSASDGNRVKSTTVKSGANGQGAFTEYTTTAAVGTALTYVAFARASTGNVAVGGDPVSPAFIKVRLT